MFKFLPLFKPRAGMSIQECQDHLRFVHGRIAATETGLNRHQCKYVQNFPISAGVGPEGQLATDWAGMVEDYFYSAEGFDKAQHEPCYDVFREDEVRFASFEDPLLVAATASPVFGPAEDTPYKVWRFASYGDGVSEEDGRVFWETSFAAAVATDERLRRVLTSYVQDRPVPFKHTFPVPPRTCDLVDEFWIKSLDVMPEFLAAEQDLRSRVGFEERVDPAATIMFVAEAKLVWDFGEDPAAGLSRMHRWEGEHAPAGNAAVDGSLQAHR